MKREKMQLVTDSACDLLPEQIQELNCSVLPLSVTLEGKTYRSGVDMQSAEFYTLLDQTESFPTTSQPSAGDFAQVYRRLAQTDPDILSIHISSGLSGTMNSARAGAEMVPEANVTFFDSLTLSSPLGWMVQAAGRAIQCDWSLDRILNQLKLMQPRTQGIFTLNTLKYLVHGGRISHLKGLMASMLKIRPIIGPEKEHGTYAVLAQEITMGRALNRIPDVVAKMFGEGTKLRIQLLHGHNPDAVETLREVFNRRFTCQFDLDAIVSPSLGAHTGSSLVGLAVGDAEVFGGLF